MDALFLPTSLPLNLLSSLPAALVSPRAHALPAEERASALCFFPAFCRCKCLRLGGLRPSLGTDGYEEEQAVQVPGGGTVNWCPRHGSVSCPPQLC